MSEINGLDGSLPQGKVYVIASRYNASICDALVEGSIETLAAAGFGADATPVIRVPGAWELPIACRRVIDIPDVIGVVTLGCVIKGETTHDEHINRAVSLALMNMSVETGLPIGFGLLTCNTTEQAIHRSGGNVGNKGNEAAEAVVEMLRLNAKIV